jgi:formylglycine-generating enzyme required for sulfatase activity
VLGLEHEQQHLELAATDIKHAFFTNPLHPAYAPTSDSSERLHSPAAGVGKLHGTAHPGLVSIGVTPDPAAIDSFAFDNETPRNPVYLAPFRLASRPVACAEYLAFIEEDGY